MKLTLIAPNASLTEGDTRWVSGQTHDVPEAVGKKLIKARPEIWSTDGTGGHVASPVAEPVAAPIEPNKTPEALATKKKPNLATPVAPVAPSAYKPPSKDEAPDEDERAAESPKRGSRRTK